MVEGQVTICTLKMAPIVCPETSVRKYHSTLRKISQTSADLIYILVEA